MQFKPWFCLFALMLAANVFGQLKDDDPDWKELQAPPPPSFSTDKLVPIDMPPHLTLKFGIDPATLAVMPDGIVRYVMVASSPTGAMNAMYEGIRCATAEFKTYARYTSSGTWNTIANPPWRKLDDNASSKHARALALQGLCEGRTVMGNSAQGILRALKGQNLEPTN